MGYLHEPGFIQREYFILTFADGTLKYNKNCSEQKLSFTGHQ
jgi:hypothetical protein